MKEKIITWIGPICFLLGVVLLIIWCLSFFFNPNVIIKIIDENNKIKYIEVLPELTKKSIINNDTTIILYNKYGDAVLKIKNDTIIYSKIKK